jgi:hypothetical protein
LKRFKFSTEAITLHTATLDADILNFSALFYAVDNKDFSAYAGASFANINNIMVNAIVTEEGLAYLKQLNLKSSSVQTFNIGLDIKLYSKFYLNMEYKIIDIKGMQMPNKDYFSENITGYSVGIKYKYYLIKKILKPLKSELDSEYNEYAYETDV